MRNGQNQEQARANEAHAEEPSAFENLAIERPAAAVDAAPAQETAPEHLSGTSFSFTVDRPATPAHAPQQPSLEPQARLERFPELDAELEHTELSPRQQRVLSKENAKAHATQTKKLRAAPGIRSPRGASSLLDRYVSFIARFMKMFEKFLLKLLRRQQGEPGPRNAAAKAELAQEDHIESQPQKLKRKIAPRGPRL